MRTLFERLTDICTYVCLQIALTAILVTIVYIVGTILVKLIYWLY